VSVWYTKAAIRAVYANAPKDDALLDDLLAVAKDDVRHIGGTLEAPYTDPADEVGTDIPARWRMAQLFRVKEVWEGQQANGNTATPEQIGMPGYQIRVPAMSRRFKGMVRVDLDDVRVG
jgi:hypothetical protein